MVWKRSTKEVLLFLDGQEVGSQSGVPTTVQFRDDFPPFYDIGQKRDITNNSLKGYLRDLMIIEKELTGEELATMAGENCKVKPFKFMNDFNMLIGPALLL